MPEVLNGDSFNRVSLKERNLVQYFIFQKALGEKPEGMSDNDWGNKQSAWYEEHGVDMSAFIDQNKEVRGLILTGNFEAAADLILQLLAERPAKAA